MGSLPRGTRPVLKPGVMMKILIARANSVDELKRMRSSQRTFSWFFGGRAVPLDVRVDRTVSSNESLRLGSLEIQLIPVSGGETNW